MSDEYSVADLALRIVETREPGAWFVLTTSQSTTLVGNALEKQMVDLGEPLVVHLVASTPRELQKALQASLEACMLISNAERYSAEEWSWIDQGRSRFLRSGATVMILSLKAVGLLEAWAPNLASLVGAKVWAVGDPSALDDYALEARLRALRAWSGKSDAEVIALAKSGELPLDPPYAEWIALLGRGDLLVG